jgi:hypothetical protein
MPLAGGVITPAASFARNDVGGYYAIGKPLYVVLQLGSHIPLVRVALP